VIEPAVFADRRFAVASVASICCQLGFFSVYFGMPLYMTEVWGWSALQVGLGLLPFNAVPILTAVPAGRIVDRHGPRGMMAFGGVLTAICYVALGLWIVDLGYTWVAVTLVISGLGSMAIGNHTTIAALRGVDDAKLGAANAGYFMTRRLGSALGAVATAAIVGNRTGAEFADVFVWVWMFGAAVYLIGGLAVWLWYPSGRHDTEPAAGVTV
jgi:MFS family permease